MSAPSPSSRETPGLRLLRRLCVLVCAWPKTMIYGQIVLFAFCVYYTCTHFDFSTSRSDLVGADKKYHQNFLRFRKEFPAQDDIVVVAESERIEKNRQFVERLGTKLEAETNLFTDVFYKGDLQMMGRKALMFVPDDDLKSLGETLHQYRPFIDKFSQATNLVSLFSLINTQFRTAKEEENEQNKSLVKALPALERIIRQGCDAMARSGSPPSPGVTALFGAGPEAESGMYITFAGGKMYLVTARAKSDDVSEKAVDRLRELVAETQREVPGLNVGVTGEPVLEIDEMRQSQHDSTKASIISLIICALIFIYGYQGTGRPLKATFSLIIGIGYTMAFTMAVVGHLNILTITFVPILIGLAIDFGVHLITRFEEELRAGRSPRAAVETAMVYTGLGIITGALTTASAFLAMGGTSFKGIQEMGIICGGGMLLCLIPMMTMLPAMLLRGRQNVLDAQAIPVRSNRRERIERLWLDRPGLVISLTLVLCGLCVTQFSKIHFDYNLLNMQSKGLPAVEFSKKLIYSGEKSVLFVAVIATNKAEAQQLEARIRKLPSVQTVESMSRFLNADQTRKLELARGIRDEAASVQFADTDRQPIQAEELSRTLWYLQGYLGLAIQMTQADEPAMARELDSLRLAIQEFRALILAADTDSRQRLTEYQRALFADIQGTFQSLREQDTRSGLTEADLPLSLKNRFIGRTGQHMLQVYPKKDVWQRENQQEFVDQIRQELNPDDAPTPIITGTPVQLLEYTTLLKISYQQAAWYALAVIAVLVFLHFRSFVCVILALLPVAIGSVWLLGLMGWHGVMFNPANIMTLPLVIGIGVTNGIHILNRFAEEQNPSLFAKSTGKAVFVSGLNTVAGFGSLLVAQHQGIASLGFVMAIGITTCMVAGLTFLPALLMLLMRWGWRIKKPSAEMHKSALGSEEPR